jgi:hypothetical protein
MKLPIELDIELDTIWTEYKSQLEKVQTPAELTEFVNRWREIFLIEMKEVNQQTLDDIRTANMNLSPPRTMDNLVAELILPRKIMMAMINAQRYIVPLNCAFIQGNGGLGAFYDD